MSRLWPISEAAQGDYETLRAAALTGGALIGPAAGRFETTGVWGLICRPSTEAVFTSQLLGAQRAAWTPYGDPRIDALADVYEFVLAAANVIDDQHKETGS